VAVDDTRRGTTETAEPENEAVVAEDPWTPQNGPQIHLPRPDLPSRLPTVSAMC
jgi:hypothetical protein